MWSARPIFISSTFLDMQAERDYLRTRVFPELEERLRARRHHLEWVDLRVGVATASQRDEHLRELYVLKVCLAEVARCRPFLIVLVGDRYGWVPAPERIEAAAAEAGFATDVAGRSVTDLEIDFGVLADREQQPHSVFYFRDPLPYRDMPAAIAALYSDAFDAGDAAADRTRRLATLKRRIETLLPGRVRRYAAKWDTAQLAVTGLEDWGRMVLEDIWSDLDAATKAASSAAEIPWQMAERNALDDFIEDRSRDFVGRRALLGKLTDFAASPAPTHGSCGICITGEAGSGKSALFGELHRRLGRPMPSCWRMRRVPASRPLRSIPCCGDGSTSSRPRSAPLRGSPRMPARRPWTRPSRRCSAAWPCSDASSCWSTRSTSSKAPRAVDWSLGCPAHGRTMRA